MRFDLRRKLMPFWKQDALALLTVIIYLGLAFWMTQAWSILSDQVDNFTNRVDHVDSR